MVSEVWTDEIGWHHDGVKLCRVIVEVPATLAPEPPTIVSHDGATVRAVRLNPIEIIH